MSKTISVRVSDDTYAAVTNAASQCGLSINDWLKLCVQDSLQFSESNQSVGAALVGREINDSVNRENLDNGFGHGGGGSPETSYITEEPKRVNPAVTTPLTPEMQRKWGCLIRGGKFTGSASEYQSFMADAADLALCV
jgi:hypothetical protein